MGNDFSRKLGLRIRELRLAKGLKQGELADILEMERSNLTRIESGRQRPNYDNLIKLAEIFNVEVQELFSFGHQKNKSELRKDITKMVNNSSEKELILIYKFLRIVREMK